MRCVLRRQIFLTGLRGHHHAIGTNRSAAMRGARRRPTLRILLPVFRHARGEVRL
jgi:hypothetical protein